jgi:hypothetical protein
MNSFVCPTCSALNQANSEVRGNQFQCYNCNHPVYVDPQGNVVPGRSLETPAADAQSPAQSEDWDLLDYLQDILLRMILGIFRFPGWLVNRYFRKVIQLLVVLLLLVIFVSISFGPFFWVVITTVRAAKLDSPADNEWFVPIMTNWEMIGGTLLWLLFSLVGAAWGLSWLKPGLMRAIRGGTKSLFSRLKWWRR